MADFRTIDTGIWREDDWFQNLPLDARLFWIYLFTNPSASVAGIYKLPMRTMANESGLSPERVAELLAQFESEKKAYYANGVIWVRKMREHQLPGKISPQLAAHLKREIEKIPASILKEHYMIAYGYSIDRVSIPRATDTDTDTDTHTDTEGDAAQAPAFTPPPSTGSSSSGRKASETLKALNDKVPPELRRPIVDELLNLTGKRALADLANDAGQRVLTEAHENAVALYQMGYKTAEDLLRIEPIWAADWRGKNGGSFRQFLEFASEQRTGRNGNGKKAPAGESKADAAIRMVEERAAARAAQGVAYGNAA